MKVIYIAGPFRGPNAWEIEQNIRRAETLALEVWKLGAAAICPHANTRFFQNAAPDKVWLDGDLEILKRCDAILMTDDWEKSEGAKAEYTFAKKNGIPVFYSVEFLKIWLACFNVFSQSTLDKAKESINYYKTKLTDEDHKQIHKSVNKFYLSHFPNTEPKSICAEADELCNPGKGERSNAYGHPLDDYTRTTKAFNALTGLNLTPEQGIMFMQCVKMSREVNCPKRDNRVDGAGYWKCLDLVHQEKERRKKKD